MSGCRRHSSSDAAPGRRESHARSGRIRPSGSGNMVSWPAWWAETERLRPPGVLSFRRFPLRSIGRRPRRPTRAAGVRGAIIFRLERAFNADGSDTSALRTLSSQHGESIGQNLPRERTPWRSFSTGIVQCVRNACLHIRRQRGQLRRPCVSALGARAGHHCETSHKQDAALVLAPGTRNRQRASGVRHC